MAIFKLSMKFVPSILTYPTKQNERQWFFFWFSRDEISHITKCDLIKKSTHVGFSVDWSIRSFDFIYLHNSYYKAFAYVSHFFRSHEINDMFTHKKNIQMCVSRMNESRKNQKNKISIPIRTEGRWKRTFLLVDLSWHSDWCISVAHTWK